MHTLDEDEKTPDTGFNRWYDKNKEAHNAKRREQYKKDPEVREKARNRAKQTRESGVNSTGLVKEVTRKWNGVTVTCYPISSAGTLIGRNSQTIRVWEWSEYIPKPIFDEAHRLYTKAQIELLKELSAFTTAHKGAALATNVDFVKLVKSIQERWSSI